MEESGKKSGRVLVNAALVTEELLVKAKDQQENSGRRQTEILIALGGNAEAIRQALATRLRQATWFSAPCTRMMPPLL